MKAETVGFSFSNRNALYYIPLSQFRGTLPPFL